MDAVQVLQIAAGPANVLQGGSGPQVVPGDSGASQLFRIIFEGAAGSVRVQEGATGGLQALAPVAVSNALQASETHPEGEAQAEPMEPRASHRIAVVPEFAEAAKEKAPAKGVFPGMKGEGAKKGGSAGTRLEQALMENRHLLEITAEKQAENPSGKGVEPGLETGEERGEEVASALKSRSRMPESGTGILPPLHVEPMEAERVVTGRAEVMPVRVRGALEAGRGEVVMEALNRKAVDCQVTRDVIMQTPQNDLKQEVKGESVYRRLPGGMTVQTPAVTAATGNCASEITITPIEVKPEESVGAATAGPAGSETGRVFPQAAVETGEAERVAGKTHSGRRDKVNIDGRGDYSRTGMQEQKQEVQGDTVYRRVPGGVDVLNPSRTIVMGNPAFRDAAVFPAKDEPKGLAALQEAEPHSERSSGGPVQTVARKTEPSSNGGGMDHRPGADAGDGSPGWQVNRSPFGDVEKTVRAELRTTAEHVSGEAGTRLREEILSQVRDRLADPALAAGGGRIRLKLNPGELGELQMHVRMEDRRMSVEITSSNPVVKETLLQNLDQLKDTLSRQNISMERFDVSTGTGHQGAGQSFREGHRPEYRQSGQMPLNPGLYPREEPAEVRHAGWESGENRLVDMRL